MTRKELTGDERPNYRNASRGPSDNDIKRMLEKDKEGITFKLTSTDRKTTDACVRTDGFGKKMDHHLSLGAQVLTLSQTVVRFGPK